MFPSFIKADALNWNRSCLQTPRTQRHRYGNATNVLAWNLAHRVVSNSPWLTPALALIFSIAQSLLFFFFFNDYANLAAQMCGKNERTKQTNGKSKCLAASTGVCCCASAPVRVVNKQGSSSSCWWRIASKASALNQLLRLTLKCYYCRVVHLTGEAAELMSLRLCWLWCVPKRYDKKKLKLTSGSRPVKPCYAMLG